jgi:hypothetical protein
MEDTPIIDLTDGVSIDLSESACAAPYRLTMASDRARQFLDEGYPRSVVPFLLRLEGRECTILDFTAARALTEGEEAELRAVQRTLDELKAITRHQAEPEPLESSPLRPTSERSSEDRPTIRRVPEAATTREALRRLLHVRGTQWEQHTGETWSKAGEPGKRRDLIRELWDSVNPGREVPDFLLPSSAELDRDELSVLVDWLTTELEKAGFDLAAADAEYEQRRAQRAAAYGEVA